MNVGRRRALVSSARRLLRVWAMLAAGLFALGAVVAIVRTVAAVFANELTWADVIPTLSRLIAPVLSQALWWGLAGLAAMMAIIFPIVWLTPARNDDDRD